MKNMHVLLLPGLFLALLLMGANWPKPGRKNVEIVSGGMSLTSVLCGSPSGTVVADADGKFIGRLSGWGNRHYAITTKSDSAQYYFNQGLGFYYGYHFSEALASFKEATRFDPSSAMTYWGQALAMGPFYNTFIYKMPKQVPEVVAEMQRNATNVNAKERDVINAMTRRYSTDITNADRTQLNRNYASALELLTQKYSSDSDIGALYIDAVMLEHKWDFWSNDGTPRAWTNALVGLSESILKRDRHPAVLHYYIHLVEASRNPQRALSSANELKAANPGIGHMVHMATHMYQRNGLYSLGVSVNEEANAVNNGVDRRVPSLKLGQDRSTHFFAVQSFCAMTAGMYTEGIPVYERARRRMSALSPDLRSDTYGQFVYMMPVLARIRLGKWPEILSEDAPDSTWKYAHVLDQFARGVAYVRGKDLAAAEKCLNRINSQLGDSLLAVRYMPYNSPLQSCRIASALLEGEILFARGKHDASFAAFQRAVAEEDNLIYREPHDWVVPSRQFLGKYLYKAGRIKEAEAVYLEDLVDNPENGWSLVGLQHCLKARGKAKEAGEYELRCKKAFASADVKVGESVL
jgi:tetratricopeptide (TPR) repeat protein